MHAYVYTHINTRADGQIKARLLTMKPKLSNLFPAKSKNTQDKH